MNSGSGRPGEFLTLSDADGVYTATDLDSFLGTLNDGDEGRGNDGGRSVLDHPDGTLFILPAVSS